MQIVVFLSELVPKCAINDMPALIQIMVHHHTEGKLLIERTNDGLVYLHMYASLGLGELIELHGTLIDHMPLVLHLGQFPTSCHDVAFGDNRKIIIRTNIDHFTLFMTESEVILKIYI